MGSIHRCMKADLHPFEGATAKTNNWNVRGQKLAPATNQMDCIVDLPDRFTMQDLPYFPKLAEVFWTTILDAVIHFGQLL